MIRTAFPSDIIIWGTAATRGAFTCGHENDAGVGTISKIMTGSKYWVVSRPKLHKCPPGNQGDMGSTSAFPPNVWSAGSSNHDLWDHEGILLTAGDTLFVMFSSRTSITDDHVADTCGPTQYILN
jgi:hypothetical protein